jgi:hypothetical protein
VSMRAAPLMSIRASRTSAFPVPCSGNSKLPELPTYRYVILDRDTKFDAEVLSVLRSIGLEPKRTSRESP